MASSNTPSRLGFTDGSSDASFAQDNENFLVEFGGLMMTQFDKKTIFKDLHEVRTIQSGKSAQFMASGKTTASYHTPGTELVGKNINLNFRTINIDSQLVSDVAVDSLDEAKSHFEVKAGFAHEIADALAQSYDRNIAQLLVLAARASATVSGGYGGSTITGANFRTIASDLAEGIMTALQTLDEKDVPEEDRFVALSPAQYYLLLNNLAVLNKDIGGIGMYNSGQLFQIGGATIVKSNNIPSSVIAAVTGEQNTYSGTFTNTAGIVFQKKAVGTVKLRDLVAETSWDPRRLCHLLTGRYAVGHGILRPECAVELKIA